MKLFIRMNSFEKVVCEIAAFLSRDGWVKTCFVVSLWVFLLYPMLPSPSFSWHAQTGSAGRCLCDAAVTTPSRFSGVDRPSWHREAAARNPAPTHLWDDCARARRAMLGFELVLPGIVRPLSYPPTLQAALWHTRLWVQRWHWWLIYILDKLSIFLSIITREMGKLKTHSPIYCVMNKWECMFNLTHTLDKIYLTGIL